MKKYESDGWRLQRQILYKMSSRIMKQCSQGMTSVEAICNEVDMFPQNLKQYYANALLLSYVRKTYIFSLQKSY